MSRRNKRKRRGLDPEIDPAAVEMVMQHGYFVKQLSAFHWRVQGKVDFWPTTERWYDPHGYRPDRQGKGVLSLIEYLLENYGDPLSEA